MEKVLLDIDDHIATVTINRPDIKNAIDSETSQLLWDIFTRLRDDDDVWIAILTATGDVFSAGRDLKERKEKGNTAPGPRNADLYGLLEDFNKPTISAVNGPCVAAAFGLAFLMDIRIASRNAKFSWPHSKRGLASVSGPCVLAAMVPENIALEYMYTGEFMTAEEAFELKLLNKLVEPGEALDAAMEMAHKIRKGAPMSMRLMKEALRRSRTLSRSDAFILGQQFSAKADATEDVAEGLAAFVEHREPVWQGR